MKRWNDLRQSRYFSVTVFVIGFLLVSLVSFAAGVAVGLHKARFSFAWGENYERNFMGGRYGRGMGSMMKDMMDDWEGHGFRNGHGVAGAVLSIGDKTLVVRDNYGKENTVNVTDKTLLKQGRDDIAFNDIKTGDNVVVLGTPDQEGVINADIVRLFPPNEPQAQPE